MISVDPKWFDGYDLPVQNEEVRKTIRPGSERIVRGEESKKADK